MSTTIKPRPRPKPRTKFSAPDTSSNASSSSSTAQVQSAADEKKAVQNNVDNFFMRNSTADFVASAARRSQLERQVAQSVPKVVHVSNEEDDDTQSSGGKRRRKEIGLPVAPKLKKQPSWTRKLKRLSDIDDSDVVILSSGGDSDEDEPSASKRARSTTTDRKIILTERRKVEREKQRKKSRSLSITPPPEVTEAERMAARQKYNEQFPTAPRRPLSPDPFLTADTSTDSLAFLNPELRNIAAKIKTSGPPPQTLSQKGSVLSGRPEVVMITVTYIPHPGDPEPKEPQEWQWTFKVKRTQDLKVVFIHTAGHLGIPVARLKLCYKHEEVFKSVSPDHFSDIWAEAEFEAYLDTTLAYIRQNRFNSLSKTGLLNSLKDAGPSNSKHIAAPNTSSTSNGAAPEQQDAEDGPIESDRLNIFLQAGPKKVSIKTRKKTVAMKLLLYFVKTVPGGREMSEEEIRAGKIKLRCDGEDVPYEMCCRDMNDGDGLETGDCLDVAGWK